MHMAFFVFETHPCLVLLTLAEHLMYLFPIVYFGKANSEKL